MSPANNDLIQHLIDLATMPREVLEALERLERKRLAREQWERQMESAERDAEGER